MRLANRVLLAPLAGIGNWFVRLQAHRHGAGLAVSEMVSSFGLHYRNERTLRELMRIHPDEHPVSIQLFGHDPDVMRSAAAIAAEAGADLIDINMGCPVRKVRKTGAGAGCSRDPELALALARGAAEGSGLPVTVKLRSGLRAGDRSGFELARPPRRGGRRRGDRLPPAPRRGRPQGRAGLRAGARAGRARSTVPVIISGGLRPPRRPAAPTGVGRRRGDDRPRLARQPLGLRGADRAPQRAAAPRGDRRRAALDDRPRRGAPRAPSAPPATCASSTPGTSRRSSAPARSPRSYSAAPTCPRARELIAAPSQIPLSAGRWAPSL